MKSSKLNLHRYLSKAFLCGLIIEEEMLCVPGYLLCTSIYRGSIVIHKLVAMRYELLFMYVKPLVCTISRK